MSFRIHDKYLLRQFLRVLMFSVLAFTAIYVTVDVFEQIDNFLDHNASATNIARYYLFSLPFILTYIIPVSLLLATVFAMGIMSRRNEITALLASGISLTRVAAPILLVAILVSLASAWFNDVVVVRANRERDHVMRFNIEGSALPNESIKYDFKYLGANGYLYLAESYNQDTRVLYDVVVQQFAEGTLVRRMDAVKATWEDSVWVFTSGVERNFDGSGEVAAPFERLVLPEVQELPRDFAREERDPEEMTARELLEFIDRLRRSGGAIEKHMVDFYFKFSFPFAGAIFVLIGIAFASGKRKPSIATGFGLTLGVAFVYYIVLRVGQTLGHNGVLPPLLAAQSGNVIFLAVGAALLFRANR